MFFGKDPEQIPELVLDLFARQRIPDHAGFQVNLRPVAWSGWFRLRRGDAKRFDDTIGPNTNRVFHLDKGGQAGQFLITAELRVPISHLFSERGVTEVEVLLEPLKGFEKHGSVLCYLLQPPLSPGGGRHLLPDLYRQAREKLRLDVQKIPVLGGIASDIPMEENFINLTLDAESPTTELRAYGGRFSLRMEVEPPDASEGDHTDAKTFGSETRDRPRSFSADELYETQRRGLIFGLPGAGKTTILRHFVFRALKDEPNAFVLLVNCRDMEQTNFPRADADAVQLWQAFVGTFLFPKKQFNALPETDHAVLSETARVFRDAWAQGQALLLVDALDETPTPELKRLVVQITRRLFSEAAEQSARAAPATCSRLFLTARNIEQSGLELRDQPVFHVNSLELLQLYSLAGHFYDASPRLLDSFKEAISGDRADQAVAGTPLMAMLVVFYFREFQKFDMRYATYDLVLRFLLWDVWRKLKSEAPLRWNTPGDLLRDVTGANFLQAEPAFRRCYDALSSLCHDALHLSVSGAAQRTIPDATFSGHFTQYLVGSEDIGEGEAKLEAQKWFEHLCAQHLLLKSGPDAHVFMHATVMEFLAARHLASKADNPQNFTRSIRNIAQDRNAEPLETLPLLCGCECEMGYSVLAAIRLVFENESGDSSLPYRCLAETEAAEEKAYTPAITEPMRKALERKLRNKASAKTWVYQRVGKLVMSTNAKPLQAILPKYEKVLPLRRQDFPSRYLGPWRNEPSELVSARQALLERILGTSVLANLEGASPQQRAGTGTLRVKILVTESDHNLLTLDHVGNPEDKNFLYYDRRIGPALRGFYGSPNLRHSAAVRCTVFSRDGTWAISGSDDGTLKQWEVKSGKELRTLAGHKASVWACTLSGDGQTLVSGSRDNTLKLWDVNSGKELRTFAGHKHSVSACALSGDGQTLVSGSWDLTLKLWDVKSGKELRTFAGHGDYVSACALSGDGQTLVSGSWDQTLKLWEVKSGKELRTFAGHKASVWACALSSDGPTLVSGSGDNTLKLWEVKSGKELRTFTGHKHLVRACVLSVDGQTLMSGSDDNTLKLWEVKSGKGLRTFAGHKDSVIACALSGDGQTLVSGSGDQTLRVWNIATGDLLHTFDLGWIPQQIRFSPADPHQVFTANANGTLTWFDLRREPRLREHLQKGK